MTRIRPALFALSLLLLAAGCSGKKCDLFAREKVAPPKKPAPPREKVYASPADYRIVQTLSSDTAALSPEILAAQDKTRRRIAEAGEGTTQPPLPGEFSAGVLAGTMVAVRWQAVDGAQSLQLDRAGPDGVFTVIARLPPDADEFTDGPLPPGKWSYRVRALGDRSASPFTPAAEVVVAGPDGPPDQPGPMSVLPAGPAAVKLEWDDSSRDEDYFIIERQAPGTGFTPIAQLGPGAEAYIDAAVEVGSTCSYRVVAVNARGRGEATEGPGIRLERPAAPPVSPVEFTAGDTAGSVELRWLDRSEDETGFVIERRQADRDYWLPLFHVPANAASFLLPRLPDRSLTLRVRAENAAGQSEPTNDITVRPRAELLATFVVTFNPATGEVTVSDPGDQAQARMEARAPTFEEEAVSTVLWVTNLDPDSQLEDVYALVEHSDAAGVFLDGCDFGPADCSVDAAADAGERVGYQYTEDPYLGRAPLGAELEAFGPRLPVRDLFPACGGVGVKWTMRGLRGHALVTINLYGRRAPADFRQDIRFDPGLPTWRLSTFAPGVADLRHEPGAAENPTARPLHDFRPGEVVAVNLGIEAADWMESQPEFGRLPDGSYLYWSQARFALVFDPEVLQPLRRPAVLGSGAVLRTGLRDPLLPPYSLFDGWGVTRDLLRADLQSEPGLVHAAFRYPPFSLMPGAEGNPVCAHCFLEGFTGPSGAPQGPDPDDDARLAVIYFEVKGAPGTGSALRLLPWPQARLSLAQTSGTVDDSDDDLPQSELREISRALSPAGQLPGDYQVSESYICVR